MIHIVSFADVVILMLGIRIKILNFDFLQCCTAVNIHLNINNMELKDLKRPLMVVGLKSVEEEFNNENLDKICAEAKEYGEGVVIIIGEEQEDFEECSCIRVGDIQSLIRDGLEIAESFKEDGFEKIYLYYSQHKEIINMDSDGNPPLSLYQIAMQAAFSMEDIITCPELRDDFDVYYYATDGLDDLFSLIDGKLKKNGADSEYQKLNEFAQTLRRF